MNLKTLILIALRIIAAVILLQTLYFKFTAHPESVELFGKLHMEPWGRVGTGVLELIAGVCLLLNPTVIIGAILSLALMSGAIVSYLTVIGIESKGDGGQLFILALLVFIISGVLTRFYWKQIEILKEKLF